MNAPAGPVLIAYDGSVPARRAVGEAAKLLGSHRVIVVTIWEEGLAYATAAVPDITMAPAIDPVTELEIERDLRGRADTVSREGAELARSLGLDAEPIAVAEAGNVAHTILSLAAEHQAAAIVVGSRGLSGLRARLEGSTSKGVLKDAACPVIVVHEPDEPAGPDEAFRP
jgi:nucleotide-binding universal stress UspA family protein